MASTDADARAAGFSTPVGTNLISGGDDAIRQNARVTLDLVNDARFIKPFAGSGGDLDTFTTPGLHGYWSDTANIPPTEVPTSGTVLVLPPPTGTGAARTQIAFPYGTQTSQWKRFYGTYWSEWTRMDAGAVAPPLVEGGRGSGSALKRVPLALTAATASGEDAAGAGAIRFPLHYGATVTRWRLHVRNYNYASGTPLTSGGTVTGVWLGKGWAGAFTAAPTKVADGLTIPTDGSEVVTPWISAPLDAGVQQMLSVGWTASTSSPKVRTAGGAWVSASSGTASAQSGAGFSVSSWVPFDWWIEAETAPTTPTIAGYGDSITAGTGTSLILNDSWLSQYARSIGALPVHWAYPGSGMVLWTNPADQKWTRWADFPLADAVIHVMGQNDLGTATTAAIMRERFETTLPMIRAHISPVVAVSTVTPHANKTEAQNAVRREHAAWLKTLPHGVIDVFDFAAAVSTDDTVLRPEYRGGNGTDELHPNTAGAAALAAAITRPVVATPARDALTAYAAEIGD